MSLIDVTRKRGLIPSFNALTRSFFKDDDDFFSDWTREEKLPLVNVEETDNAFQLSLAAPGLKKNDFNIEVDKGMLVISSEKSDQREESEDNYTRREFSYSSFRRSFWLPENVYTDGIKARYEEGLLKVTIPKMEVTPKEAPKKITVG